MVAVVALGVMMLVTAVQLGRRFGAVEQGVTDIKTTITATDATIAKMRSEFRQEFVQFREDIREVRKRPTAPAGAMETPGLTILGALTPEDQQRLTAHALEMIVQATPAERPARAVDSGS